MSAKDDTERVLRDIHVLFSKAEPVDGSAINVVVNKNEAMELLRELNSCMYDMMDEYELTTRSRAKAERELKREGDDIVFDSTRKAEDIYAASVMYTDNALDELEQIISDAIDRFDEIVKETTEKGRKQLRQIKKNKGELRSELNDLIDTRKYINLIEDENRRRAKEKKAGEREADTSENIYADAAPQIIVNEEYFRMQGLNPDGTPLSEGQDMGALSEDLDAEYFGWKEEESAKESRTKGGIAGLFGKKK